MRDNNNCFGPQTFIYTSKGLFPIKQIFENEVNKMNRKEYSIRAEKAWKTRRILNDIQKLKLSIAGKKAALTRKINSL